MAARGYLEVLHVAARAHVPEVGDIITGLGRCSGGEGGWPGRKQSQVKMVNGLTPDTKVLRLGPGARSILITSDTCPWKVWGWPVTGEVLKNGR